MNRHDEIQALARDVASNIHVEPDARNAMADDLIKLIAAMLSAQGKRVAVYGEGAMNDAIDFDPADQVDQSPEILARMQVEADQDAVKYHGIYLAGEQMQTAASQLEERCTNPRVDLERYGRPTGDEWCVCGHHPDSHRDGTCIGQKHNKHACTDGPCTEFRAEMPEPAWTHIDRRPERLRLLAGPGTLALPKVFNAPELCSKCTDTKPCDNPGAGCTVAPPVRYPDHG